MTCQINVRLLKPIAQATVNLGARPHSTQLPQRLLSEALAVNNRGTALVIFALGNPHLLESRQRGQDGASDPHRILALRWSHDLDLHCGGREGSDLFGHALADSSEHGGATRKNYVSVQILPDIDVALHNRLESCVVDSASLLSDEARLEEHLRTTEAFTANGDDVAIGKLVGLFLVGGLGGGLHLSVVVECNIGQLLLHIADDFALGCRGERVTPLG